jgi:HicB family
MELSNIINALKADLSAVADVGDETAADAANRLTVALQASIGLRFLDALSQAALEVTAQLPEGRVEVRLSGQDPELVYVGEEPEPATAAADEAYTARITLRLPEGLKTSLEKLAAGEGVSLNTWIVRALQKGTAGPAIRSSNRLTGYARS